MISKHWLILSHCKTNTQTEQPVHLFYKNIHKKTQGFDGPKSKDKVSLKCQFFQNNHPYLMKWKIRSFFKSLKLDIEIIDRIEKKY